MKHRASRGFCVGNIELRCVIRQAAIASATRPIPESFPCRTYVDRWMKKHAESISFRKARILEEKRAEASTEAVVRYYFGNMEAAIDELQLRDRPAQIWNCDETGVCPQGCCQQRVVAPKGMPADVQRSSDRENVSIMRCINADGSHMPPMYIFAGKRRKVEWMAEAPPSAVCAITKSSNINECLFLHWVTWFVGRLPAVRPQLLISDGHFAHMDYDTVTWAKARGFHLFALPAHTSHFLQPLDVGVYQPFKRLYEGELEQFPLTTGFLPAKDDIVRLTKQPFEKALAEEKARKSFQKAGIYPLSLERMLDGLIGNEPSTEKKTLRHHAVILPHVEMPKVSEHQQHCLKRKGLNMDALNVVNIAVGTSITPATKTRDKGTYLDERSWGDVLLTNEEMLTSLEKNKTAKVAKQQAKLKRAGERARAKIVKAEARMKLAAKNALDREERILDKTKTTEEKVLKTVQRLRVKEETARAKAELNREKRELRLMRNHDNRPTKKRRTVIVAWVDL